jgi:hypothetical protein
MGPPGQVCYRWCTILARRGARSRKAPSPSSSLQTRRGSVSSASESNSRAQIARGAYDLTLGNLLAGANGLQAHLRAGRRPPLTLHFVDNAGVASVGCLVLHASVHFPGFEDLLAVNKSNIHTFVDRVWVFAFKNENVGQESFNARVGQGRHRSPRAQI